MGLIPISQPDNINAPDFSFNISESMKPVFEAFRIKAQDQRLKKQAVQQIIQQYNSALPWMENHKEKASQLIEEFENQYAQMLTFDKNGKPKRFTGEPELSDSEYLQITQQATQMGIQFDKWKQNDEKMLKETEEYKKNSDKYDSETFNIIDSDYKVTGEYSRSPLEIKPANVYSYISKLDPRTPDEIKRDTVPSGNTWVTKSLDPEIQQQLYWQAATNDFAFQKGLVDMMMRDNTMSTNAKIEYIKGILAPNLPFDKPGEYMKNPALRNAIFKTHDEAIRIVNEYQTERKFDPRLIEAAAYYDDQYFGLSERIGKGGTRTNETLYNYDQRKARQKAEQEEEYMPTPEREFNFNGIKVTGVDLSRNTKAKLSNYQLPKGSYTVETKNEIENPEYIKLKNKIENSEGREKRKLEKQLKNIARTVPGTEANKQSLQGVTSDFEVVTYGADETGKDVIILKEPDITSGGIMVEQGRFIIVPMKGNEYILSQINKNFEKDQENIDDPLELF